MLHKNTLNSLGEASVLRFNNLSLQLAEMVAEGSKSTENYNYLTKEIDRITKELKNMGSEPIFPKQAETITNASVIIEGCNSQIQLLDLDIAQTKGRPSKSNKRALPLVEKFKTQKKKKIQQQK